MAPNSANTDYTHLCAETQWMPSISFMALWQTLDIPYLMEAQENYQKRSWRNRAYILNSQGRQLLSIPLDKGKNAQTPIREVSINYNEDWPEQHLRTLKAAYGSAPFYEHYIPEVEALYTKKVATLWEWNLQWLNWFIQKLYLDNEIILTEAFKKIRKPTILDVRNYDAEIAEIANMHRSDNFWYPQIFEAEIGFHANVSVIDLLFCTGPESGTYLSRFWSDKMNYE